MAIISKMSTALIACVSISDVFGAQESAAPAATDFFPDAERQRQKEAHVRSLQERYPSLEVDSRYDNLLVIPVRFGCRLKGQKEKDTRIAALGVSSENFYVDAKGIHGLVTMNSQRADGRPSTAEEFPMAGMPPSQSPKWGKSRFKRMSSHYRRITDEDQEHQFELIISGKGTRTRDRKTYCITIDPSEASIVKFEKYLCELGFEARTSEDSRSKSMGRASSAVSFDESRPSFENVADTLHKATHRGALETALRQHRNPDFAKYFMLGEEGFETMLVAKESSLGPPITFECSETSNGHYYSASLGFKIDESSGELFKCIAIKNGTNNEIVRLDRDWKVYKLTEGIWHRHQIQLKASGGNGSEYFVKLQKRSTGKATKEPRDVNHFIGILLKNMGLRYKQYNPVKDAFDKEKRWNEDLQEYEVKNCRSKVESAGGRAFRQRFFN